MSNLSGNGPLDGYIVLVREGEILTNQGICVLTNEEIDDIEHYLKNTRKLINSDSFDSDKFNNDRLEAIMNSAPVSNSTVSNKKHRPKISHAKRLRIFNKYHSRCYYCHKKLSINSCHIDHMTPISKGGSNRDDNLVLACPECNESKGTLTRNEYLLKIGDPRGVKNAKD